MGKIRKAVSRIFLYAIMIFISILCVGPFLWLLSTSLKGPSENIFGFPIQFIPKKIMFSNYAYVWVKTNFYKYTINSVIVTALGVAIGLFIAVTAGYPLARMKFPGRNIIFYVILATMIIPFQVIMLSMFELCVKLNIDNSYLGVVLPFTASAFNIFLIRQAYSYIPKELEESARIVGCSEFMIWYKIMLPLIKPSIAALAIFVAVFQWNDFLWPLVILKDYSRYTLPLAVSYSMNNFGQSWSLIATGAVIAAVPVFIFYLFMQKYFLSGIMAGAVKG